MKTPFAPIVFTLNGRRTSVRMHPLKRLLDVLREECRLTGTKEGCGEGECGACTVIVNGQAVNSCLVPVAQAAGARVTTIEGLRGRHRLQAAFADHGGAQCGICTPGMILAATVLGPRPTLDQVRTGLAGNICRCTGYEGIYRAIRKAGKTGVTRRESGVRSQKTEARSQKAKARRKKATPRTSPDAPRLRSTGRSEGGNPGSRVPSPEPRVPSPEPRVPSPEPRVPSPESRAPQGRPRRRA